MNLSLYVHIGATQCFSWRGQAVYHERVVAAIDRFVHTFLLFYTHCALLSVHLCKHLRLSLSLRVEVINCRSKELDTGDNWSAPQGHAPFPSH